MNVVLAEAKSQSVPHTANAPDDSPRNAWAHDLAAALVSRLQAFCGRWVVICVPDLGPMRAEAERLGEWRTVAEQLERALGVASEIYFVRPGHIDLSAYQRRYCESYAAGHVAIYSRAFYAGLGVAIARAVHAMVVPSRKVIVLDCDDTLWTGACAEGVACIVLDRERHAIQQFFVDQMQAGALLCLCSRNNAEDVWAVLRHHPTMRSNENTSSPHV